MQHPYKSDDAPQYQIEIRVKDLADNGPFALVQFDEPAELGEKWKRMLVSVEEAVSTRKDAPMAKIIVDLVSRISGSYTA
jgi:hypothetical protein